MDGGIVRKVANERFEVAFLGGEGSSSIGVKAGADRDEADEWLQRFPDDATVMAYIGRSGWNSLTVNGAIPDTEIFDAIDASYDWVVSKLPKRERPS